MSPKSLKTNLGHKKLGPVKKHLRDQKVNLILIFDRKRALIFKKCSILTLKKHEIKKFDRSSKTPSTKNHQILTFDHSTYLHILKIKIFTFYSLLKNHLKPHSHKIPWQLLFKIKYSKSRPSKPLTPLPYNNQDVPLIP